MGCWVLVDVFMSRVIGERVVTSHHGVVSGRKSCDFTRGVVRDVSTH